MRQVLLVGFLMSVSMTATSQALDPRGDAVQSEEPRSAAARKAKATYLRETRKLDEEYASKLQKLREHFAQDLDDARKEALASGNLDEAQRILGQKVALASEDVPAPGGQGLTVLHAVFGSEESWADATAFLRRRVKGAKLEIANTGGATSTFSGFPDPAFGKLKTAVVVYSSGGKVSVAVVKPRERVVLPLARK